MFSFFDVPCYSRAIKTQTNELAWTPEDAKIVLSWLAQREKSCLVEIY